MSVIAAKVYPDRIDIASDSILLKADLKKNDFKKIFQTSDLCAGGCGTAEELQLFFQFIQKSDPESATIMGIIDYMSKFANWKSEYTHDETIQNCYLIIYGNKLFEVDGMFVQEIKTHTAIGEGEAYALAALHLGHNVEEAVKTACDLCYYTSEPVFARSIYTN